MPKLQKRAYVGEGRGGEAAADEAAGEEGADVGREGAGHLEENVGYERDDENESPAVAL